MTVTIRQIGPCFAGEVEGIDLRQPLTRRRRSPRSMPAWTDTRCWCSTTRHRRRAAARLHPQPRRDRARDRHQPARGRTITACRPPSPTSPTSTSTTSRWPATTGAGCSRSATGCGTPTARSRQSPAKYSLLHARSIPSKGGNTEFADMRAAYDALDDETKAELRGPGLRALADLLAAAARLYRLHATRSASASSRCARCWCAPIP